VEKLHFHHKEGIDKDQMSFMEELRNTTLDLLKTRNPQSSGIKSSKFRNARYRLVQNSRQSSGITKFWSSEFDSNAPHTY
jgi:hypothetical protein